MIALSAEARVAAQWWVELLRLDLDEKTLKRFEREMQSAIQRLIGAHPELFYGGGIVIQRRLDPDETLNRVCQACGFSAAVVPLHSYTRIQRGSVLVKSGVTSDPPVQLMESGLTGMAA